MGAVDDCMRSLQRALRQSETYRAYRRLQKEVDADPKKREALDAYRRACYDLQDSTEDPIEGAERIRAEFADLLADETAQAYLDAENAVCRLARECCLQVTDALAVELPI